MVFENLEMLEAEKYLFCLVSNNSNPLNYGNEFVFVNYPDDIDYKEYDMLLLDYNPEYKDKIIKALAPDKHCRYNNKLVLHMEPLDLDVNSIALCTYKYDSIEERDLFIRVVYSLAALPGLICIDLLDIEACLMGHKRLNMKTFHLDINNPLEIDIKLAEDALFSIESNSNLSLRTIEKIINAGRGANRDTNIIYGTMTNDKLTDDEVVLHIIYSLD